MKQSENRLRTLLDILLLVAFFWFVRYWHSGQFRLYEDDLTRIPDAVQLSTQVLWQYLMSLFTQFEGQGRPFHPAFIYLFSWIGWRIAGHWGPYLIGFIITAVNIGLFYWLIRRVSHRALALLSSLAFVLYAADTTQAFLTHSLGLQPSVLLILLAMHCYLSDRRFLSYALAFIVLFGYELPFVIFAAVPLFKPDWNKHLLKELFLHWFVLGIMMGSVFALRSYIGETRVVGLTLQQLSTTPLLHMVQGPLVSLGTYVLRPVQALQDINAEIAVVVLAVFVTLIFLLWRLDIQPGPDLRSLRRKIRSHEPLPDAIKMLWHMAVTGAIMLILAYPLTFTVRAYAISGRDTRVHAAGAAGAAILIGCAAYFLLILAHGRWRWVVNLTLALFFALMAGYGFVIQSDFVRAWQLQKQFWVELLPLISDAGDGTVILVDREALTDTRQIGANYWNLPRVLMQLYDFPEDMQSVPVVHRLETGWENSLLSPEGLFRVDASTTYSVPDYYGEFEPENVILIQSEDGHLVRRKTITLGGQEYLLKQLTDPVLPNLPHGFLYNLLLDP
jgi:hypothetical protein